MKEVTQNLIYKLVSDKIIEREEAEVYIFGLQQMLINIVNITVLFIIGICMHMIVETGVFVLSFIAFRKYAGGYHSKTQLGCFTLTNIVVLIALSVMKYMRINIYIYIGLYLFAAVIIFLYAPIEAENKKLDSIERIVYRKRAMIVLVFQTLLVAMLGLLKYHNMSKCIMLSGFVLCCSMLFGMIKAGMKN
ncbi:MAG: accessory gene regulator ArgB-like protein [Butyribacter sp.]|uniref:accessory gene regulator ArgB-like protein n=1 Tax=Butyribacter TaxID=2822463 RepID=UPI00384317D3|nr:accessory gene regulator B family protein [Roseburia hominis]